MNKSYILSICIYLLILLILWTIRPTSNIYKNALDVNNKKIKNKIFLSCILTVFICIGPMNLSPFYNGEISSYTNQYELMTDSIINGHIYFDYEIDDKLIKMENPYDPQARIDANVEFYWDHAFYNGRYYMYFGIVPVLVLFVPFKLITGKTLLTYHATQIFVSMFIIGLFSLFFQIVKKSQSNKLSLSTYLFLNSSLSIISVWYISSAPALYCTAISAGICTMIWSIFFYYKSVYLCDNVNKSIFYAFIGATFGALAFGCRPPIGIANIIAIPMYKDFLNRNNKNIKFIIKNILIFLPYIIIGISLMIYNYLRFDNVFEFGQSYQLTIADQRSYNNLLSRLNFKEILYYFFYSFVQFPSIKYLLDTGCLFTYPIVTYVLVLSVINIKNAILANNHVKNIIIYSVISIFAIVLLQSLTSPEPIPRYRSDYLWIICLVIYLLVLENSNLLSYKQNYVISFLCFITILICILLFLFPYDGNYTHYFGSEKIKEIVDILSFGLIKYY